MASDPRQVDARAVRLCVLGAGAAMVATGSPWQEWQVPCFVFRAQGLPLLSSWTGALLAAMAVSILLTTALPAADARALLRLARTRVVLACLTAVLWVGPLPFGPELLPNVNGRMDWTLGYQAGAVGASAAALGAIWWLRAVARISLDRACRRTLARRR